MKTTSGDTSWYNYNESKWANAINTEDDSYFVWIPRYAYRITYYTSQESYKDGEDPIAYCDGRGLVDPEGNIITSLNRFTVNGKLDKGIETIEDKETGKSYIVHPAFMDNRENNYENGGWSKDLEGIWVAKYEMSQETSSKSGMVSKPGVSSWRTINIANMYTNSYYYDREKESHMMKNSEWGAVAYLAHSQYGTNGEKIETNDSSKTGTGSDGESAYNTDIGMLSSTTQNIYGVYDMSGGLYEYVAGYNKDYTGTESTNYFTGADYLDANKQNFADLADGASTQYVTAYSCSYDSNNSYVTYGTTLDYEVGKTGDATKGVQTGTNGRSSHWFRDNSDLLNLRKPFFLRGGYYNNGDSAAGSFSSFNSDGRAYYQYSFRIVLAQ